MGKGSATEKSELFCQGSLSQPFKEYVNNLTTSPRRPSWNVCKDSSDVENSGLANLNVVSLAIDANGKLYAGTEGGVFVSNDNCATWAAMNNGLPN